MFFPFPEMVTVSTSPRPASAENSVNIETETDYLKIAKKGGGHKGKQQSVSGNSPRKICMEISLTFEFPSCYNHFFVKFSQF